MTVAWLKDECRQQAVVYLAAATFAGSQAAKGKAKAKTCPPPLFASRGPLATALEQQAAAVAGTNTSAGIDTWVDKAFGRPAASGGGFEFPEAVEADASLPREAWPAADLVGWWLAAGEALAGLDNHLRTVIGRMLGGDDAPQHPALWCAERCERLSLASEGFHRDAQAGDWRAAGNGPGEYRLKLFRWAMSPDRPRATLTGMAKGSADWVLRLQADMSGIGADAAALFGKGVRAGGGLEWSTSDKWIAIWIGGAVGSEVINEIRRPVQSLAEGDRPIVKGVAVLPPAPTLCKQLAALTGSTAVAAPADGAAAALARATAFASSRWQPGKLVAGAWGKATEAAAVTLPIESIEPALLAVARWLTAAWVAADDAAATGSAQDQARELTEAARIALALEGFRVRPVRGGVPAGRMIPHASTVFDGNVGWEFVREASGYAAPLGRFGPPASCPSDLLAAIEAVDWRLWAFAVAPWDMADDVTRQVVEIVRGKVVRGDEWEELKQQALSVSGTPGDVEPLTRLFHQGHERRLALELLRDRVYERKPADAMIAGLIEEFAALARAALAALARVDPAAPARFEPPRRADGVIDVAAWLARVDPARGAASKYRLRWAADPQPRGTVLQERRTGTGPGPTIEVLLSAADAADAEIALLNAPALPPARTATGAERGSVGLAERLARLQSRIGFPPADGLADADPLGELRAAFAGEASGAFHELIDRCRAGDEAAKAWCRVLRDDGRFRFACHPAFDIDGGGIAAARVDDPFLSWEFDASVSAGQDLDVVFAIDPANARRVISRGPRQPGGLADRAEQLVEACRRAGAGMASLGEQARRATDLWRAFGGQAPHPILAAGPLLDGLLQAGDAPPAVRNAVFDAAVAWCEALDHDVLPAGWRADGRLAATALADVVVPPDFDDRVPTGTISVRSFGLRGVHGRPFSGVVSAGPAPAGYHSLRQVAARLVDASEVGHTPAAGEVIRKLEELAKHAIAGQLPLALPNLYDRVWEVVSAADTVDVRAAREAAVPPLLEMLKSACRMVSFEPTNISDYSAGWVREADGSQPRGRRVKRLVRPGLRTVENVLVRPALVISE